MNKRRGTSNSDKVMRVFREYPNENVHLKVLARKTGLSEDQVRGAISRIRSEALVHIEIEQRGKVWRWVPDDLPFIEPLPEPEYEELGGEDLARVTTKLGKEHVIVETETRLQLRVLGRTFEGHVLGMDDETGNVFKVVPA